MVCPTNDWNMSFHEDHHSLDGMVCENKTQHPKGIPLSTPDNPYERLSGSGGWLHVQGEKEGER